MISFFHNNKRYRDATLTVVVIFFFLGALFNDPSPSVKTTVGKRQIDVQKLQSQYHEMLKQYPGIDPQSLQESLLQRAQAELYQAQQIEAMGLRPSEQKIKDTIKGLLPKNTTLKNLSQHKSFNQNQMMTSVSDQLAREQLVSALQASTIVTDVNQQLHHHAMHHTRDYIDIDLSQASFPDDEIAYQNIFHQQQLSHPKEFYYQYVDITPSSQDLPVITETMIDDYFKEHLDDYTDQEIEYQVTSYFPSSTENNVYKNWPPYIQEAIDDFQKTHTTSSSRSQIIQVKASDLSARDQVVAKMMPGQHYALPKEDMLIILTVIKKNNTHTLNPKLKHALEAAVQHSHYQHLLASRVKMLSEDAYTNPESLEQFAKKHQLKIHNKQSISSEDFSSQLEDPDFIEHHYISPAIEVSDLHYRFIQITKIVDEQLKTYHEASGDIKQLYKEHTVYPTIIHALNQSTDIEAVKKICHEYKLTFNTHTANPKSNHEIYGLIPTTENPYPSIVNNNHWLQLQSIQYLNTQEDMTPVIQKIDHEHFFFYLQN